MSWQAVAQKDFQDAIRSRWLWALSFVFVVLFTLPAILEFYLGGGDIPDEAAKDVTQIFVTNVMVEITALFVPLIGIVMAYASITRERESGTLKLLLSLPHSRQDVVVGKVLGRSAVLTAPILLGFIVAAFLLLLSGIPFHFASYFLFALLTILLGLVFAGLAVGVSAGVDSNLQSMVTNVALFVFFAFPFVWNTFAGRVASGLTDIVNRVYGVLGMDATIGNEGSLLVELFVKLMNPVQAYKTLVDSIFFETPRHARAMMFGLRDRIAVFETLNNVTSVQFSDPFVLVYMLFWLFVPVAAGYIVFEEADL